MRLVELDPRFVRYESRVGTWTRTVGDPLFYKPGDPTEEVTGPQVWTIPVETLADAQGIWFLCPACFVKNGGAVGTHSVDVTFADRGATDDQGSHNREGRPVRWRVSGIDFASLTLQPSIDLTPACTWHGFITNGEVT